MSLQTGIIRVGAPVALAATAAAAVAVYQHSTWANQIGTKSYILRRLTISNQAGGAGWARLGITAGAGVATIPGLMMLNNEVNYWDNDSGLPPLEMYVDAVMWVDALVAGGVITAQLTVEERG